MSDMRILFLTVDYPDLLQSIYCADAGTASRKPYQVLLDQRNATLFARRDYLTSALRAIGHPAEAVHVNNLPLQFAWRRAHGAQSQGSKSAGKIARHALFRLRRLGSHGRLLVNRLVGDRQMPPQGAVLFDPRHPAVFEILAEQIAAMRPDIVYNYDPVLIDGRMLLDLKPYFGKLVAQIAAPFPATTDWSSYDLVLSSLPNYVERFKRAGVPTDYLPLYFARQIADEIKPQPRDIELSFVGSVTKAHSGRRQFVEDVASALPLELYGMLHGESEGTALARAYRGPAWGRDMYAVLGRSRVTINRHINIAENFANNLRLYEATGMGACLMTERSRNLPELFEPGREVLAYESTEECIELCRYYLAHPNEAAIVAAAGQRRCFSDHSAERHAERLIAILRQRL